MIKRLLELLSRKKTIETRNHQAESMRRLERAAATINGENGWFGDVEIKSDNCPKHLECICREKK